MGLAVPAQVTPQQALWQRTYKDVKNHSELDSNFEKLRLAITQHVGLLQRQAQVRVKNWLKKLSEETANVVWKKNRNAFARLLLEQLRAGRLAEPFHQVPPDGPLPTLPKHAAYVFAQPRSSPPTGSGGGQARRLSASEALDEYLGRQDFRQLQLEGDAAQPSPRSSSAPQPQQAAAAWPAAAAVAAPAAADVLPGTRMPLLGAESLGVDRPQLGDTRWQPSKLELEAQLGASRERERELQWRLQQAEEALRQQSQLLQSGRLPAKLEAASPVSLIDDAAFDDDVIDDGHVSPPRRRRVGRRELQELIDKHEARRRAWRTPAWHRGSSAGGRITPLQDSDEEEILEHLDNFQRQTEAIRRHLARRSSGGSSSAAGGSLFGDASLGPPGPTLSAMSSGWETGLGLGLGLGPGSASAAAAAAAAPLFSTAAPSLFSSRGGPEPSLSVAGGISARTPRYASAAAASPGSTVADGATPSVALGMPPALLATARPPMRPAGLAAPLLDGLPQSPRLGGGRGTQQQRGPGTHHHHQQQQHQQQPAVSSGSVSFGGGQQQDRGNGASTPPHPPSPASPTIRHTLKSAAAAQRTASSLRPASPASSSAAAAAAAAAVQAGTAAGAGAASQPQRRRQDLEAAAAAEPMPAGVAAAAGPVGEGIGQLQQEGWQQQGGNDATPTSRSQHWSPRRQQQQQQLVQQGGDSSALGSSRGGRQPPQPHPEPGPDPNSFAHLASGAADLRRRLEQQMGAAASAGHPARLAEAAFGAGPSESSFADLGGHTSLAGGLGLEDHLLEPSSVSSARPGALGLGLGLGLGRSGSGGSARLLEPLDSWEEDEPAGAGRGSLVMGTLGMDMGMGAGTSLGVGGLGRPRSGSTRQMLLRPSTKYRPSSDAGSEGGGSSAGGTPRAAALGGGGGGGGGRGGGKYRLTDESSLGGGGGTGGGWGLGSGDSSLEDFRRQTEAIRAQIAALGGLG